MRIKPHVVLVNIVAIGFNLAFSSWNIYTGNYVLAGLSTGAAFIVYLSLCHYIYSVRRAQHAERLLQKLTELERFLCAKQNGEVK